MVGWPFVVTAWFGGACTVLFFWSPWKRRRR